LLFAAIDLLLRAALRDRSDAQGQFIAIAAAYRRPARMRAPAIISSIATSAPRCHDNRRRVRNSFVGLVPGIVSS